MQRIHKSVLQRDEEIIPSFVGSANVDLIQNVDILIKS